MPQISSPPGPRTALQRLEIQRGVVYRQTDRLFAVLMAIQWVGAIVLALVLTPSTWTGTVRSVHPHLWAAVFSGGAFSLPPILMAVYRPGKASTRYTISLCQAFMSSLLIDITGGRIETHFHIFGSLAFLAFYRDWTVLIPFTCVTAVDHLLAALFWPAFTYGTASVGLLRWSEHVAWVVFEDVFLIVSCMRGAREMRAISVSAAEADARNLQLAAVQNGALDSIVAIDADGIIRAFNPAAEQTYGYRREDVIGQFWTEMVIPPEVRAQARARVLEAGRDGRHPWENRRVETVHMRADGTRFPVEITVAFIEQQTPRMAVTYSRDITQRKLAEEQSRHSELLSLVASGTDNAVIIADLTGKIEWANDAFCRMTEYTLEEVVGQNRIDLLNVPDVSAVKQLLLEKLTEPAGFSLELQSFSKMNRPFWLSADVRPVRDSDGVPRRLIAIERDVTARKAQEAELLRTREEAVAARAAAEDASRAKSQFLATMSHEIRTPLNGVIGMAEMLIRKGSLSQQQLHWAQVIKGSGDTLLALINDILDFSKIEAGKLELSEVDFDPHIVVEDVVELLSPRASGKGLAFACRLSADVPHKLRGDPDRLRQILTNLVSNAVKFTEKGEVVVNVAVDSASVERVMLQFAIRDTGPGVPPDRLHRLFQRFSQVDASTTRKFGGTGLGLAIVRQLSELMGGGVTVESTVGVGSIFTVTLAFAPVQTPLRTERPGLAPHLRGQRVLLVDDQLTYCEILQDQLLTYGMTPQSTDSPEHALELLRDAAAAGNPFQIAIIDRIMPGMDGPALARVIQADPALADTALIMMTAMETSLDARAVQAMGFSVCLTKPVRQSSLFDAIIGAATRGGDRTVAPARSPEQTLPGLNAYVLLAEDNEVNQEVARELLLDAGCRVDVVGNGVAAVEAVRKHTYDLVFMDCMMPEMDGFEAAATIRTMERSGQIGRGSTPIPIIALTANAIEGDEAHCLAAGMNAYLTKPIDPDKLLATVERAMKKGLPPARAVAPVPAKEQARPPAAGQTVPPIRVEEFLSRCRGKASLAERLLATFAGTIEPQLQQLHAAVESADAALLARVAHTIKGASANLSASSLSDAAAALERLGHTADFTAAAAALEGLEQQVRSCLDYLPDAGALIRQTGSKPPAVAGVASSKGSG